VRWAVGQNAKAVLVFVLTRNGPMAGLGLQGACDVKQSTSRIITAFQYLFVPLGAFIDIERDYGPEFTMRYTCTAARS
jgi:hypothetical protein